MWQLCSPCAYWIRAYCAQSAVVEFGGLFFCASALYSVEKVLSLGGSDGTPSPTQSDEDKLTGRILQLAKGTLPALPTGSISGP
jgi:hypothetical protein